MARAAGKKESSEKTKRPAKLIMSESMGHPRHAQPNRQRPEVSLPGLVDALSGKMLVFLLPHPPRREFSCDATVMP